jgi:hypothetical protein
MNASLISQPPWPRLSVACALLPLVRRTLLDTRGAPGADVPDADVLPIFEDGLLGYEIASRAAGQPVVAIGCRDDGVVRVRRTDFASVDASLRIVTVDGVTIDEGDTPARRARAQEALYADWRTAALEVWSVLATMPRGKSALWDDSMNACRSLENALTIANLHLAEWDPTVDFFGVPNTIANLHLAEWDPTVDFFGVPNQAEYGVPLRGAPGDAGSLTLHRHDAWLLYWHSCQKVVHLEWSRFSAPEGVPAPLPRDAKR